MEGEYEFRVMSDEDKDLMDYASAYAFCAEVQL